MARPQPTVPRPTAGSFSYVAPAAHSAYDALDDPPTVMGADGDEWECLPNQ
jgi:hypothetical protein